ncbi:hypothetical protein ZWY2020_051041 [Hordeum vulgare]|nr:hypothetical protein ZWY2020_051041 [Hordeum vulgare]
MGLRAAASTFGPRRLLSLPPPLQLAPSCRGPLQLFSRVPLRQLIPSSRGDGFFLFLTSAETFKNRKSCKFMLKRLRAHNNGGQTLASPLHPECVGFSPHEVDILKDAASAESQQVPEYEPDPEHEPVAGSLAAVPSIPSVGANGSSDNSTLGDGVVHEPEDTVRSETAGSPVHSGLEPSAPLCDPTSEGMRSRLSFGVLELVNLKHKRDGKAEAKFRWFDKSPRSVVGKPLMSLRHHKYPGFTSVFDLPRIGGGGVALPVEIHCIVTQKYELVVSISNKSFGPTSTHLSFQVSRINRTFKPELAPLGSAGASSAFGASSSAGDSGVLVAIPVSFPAG